MWLDARRNLVISKLLGVRVNIEILGSGVGVASGNNNPAYGMSPARGSRLPMA